MKNHYFELVTLVETIDSALDRILGDDMAIRNNVVITHLRVRLTTKMKSARALVEDCSVLAFLEPTHQALCKEMCDHLNLYRKSILDEVRTQNLKALNGG